MSRRAGAARARVLAVLLPLTATACSAQSGAGVMGGGPAPPNPKATLVAATLETSRTDVGPILVDGGGRTLYMFTADLRGVRSECGDACAQDWPVLDAPAAHAGAGVPEMLISTLVRPDGTEQITYHEHPLYYFSGDHRVGDTNGQGVTAFGGTWLMVRPDGTPVRAAAP